jgi:hypothetical protein
MTIFITPDFCDHTGRAWWLTLEGATRALRARASP